MKKVVGLLGLLIVSTLISCTPANEISYSSSSNYLTAYHRTNQRVIIGHAGLFYRSVNRYTIHLKSTDKTKYNYTDIQVGKNNGNVVLTDGYIEFIGDNQVKIALLYDENGLSKSLPINGRHKLKK
ncbi:hypothetical protein [uncultured Pontibacter sp.]|uniref:hypothetical protein n=1 Tax=uncultured Pontibacter sp. TaxID=453356 RepID=UPI002617D976|nr:hypothetical protein [uncultured Pontibacter sp.]